MAQKLPLETTDLPRMQRVADRPLRVADGHTLVAVDLVVHRFESKDSSLRQKDSLQL